MSRIPRPSFGPTSNPPSPIQSNNPFNRHLEPLSSPIDLRDRGSFASGTSTISFYSQDGQTTVSTPATSPRLQTPSSIKRRPAPPFDSASTSPHGTSPANSLRTTSPAQHPRNNSSPGSLPNAKYRTATAPASTRFSPSTIRSAQASTSDHVATMKHPQAANAVPLHSGNRAKASPGFHYLKRNGQTEGMTGRAEERPLISLDSGYTILVTRPGDIYPEPVTPTMQAPNPRDPRQVPKSPDPASSDPSKAYGGMHETVEGVASEEGQSRLTHPHHISYRLDLINHLGAVLDMSSDEIKEKLDVQGLLRRVEAMHKRSSRLPGELDAIPQRNSLASEGSYTELLQQLSEIADLENWTGPSTTPSESETVRGPQSSALGLSFSGESSGSSDRSTAQDAGRITHRPNDAGRKGLVFGVKLDVAPVGSWCTSLIGGQRHELPIVIFNITEEIFKRGMSTPGLFRLSGDAERTAELYQAYNRPPFYGDNLDISIEPIANLTSIVKRYIRDLPYPILDESLFEVFGTFCSESALDQERASRTSSDSNSPDRHVVAAQILIRLLPPLQFSLFVYLLAFLGQLQLYPENKLDVSGIAAIFGPGMCASRKKGMPGLGPGSASQSPSLPGAMSESEKRAEIKRLSDQSESILGWLLAKWPLISENLLDPSYDEHFRKPDPYQGLEAALSPVKRAAPSAGVSESAIEGVEGRPKMRRSDTPGLRLPERTLHKQQSMPVLSQRRIPPEQSKAEPTSEQTPSKLDTRNETRSPTRGRESTRTESHNATAISTSKASKKKGAVPSTPAKPKQKRSLRSRSASFGSISSLKSLFRRGGDESGLDDAGEVKLEDRKRESGSTPLVDGKWADGTSNIVPVQKDDRVGVSLTRGVIPRAAHEPDPNASAVLGSLHDLLVSKDRQIAKDAQEIKRLREALANGAGTASPNANPNPKPDLNAISKSSDSAASTSGIPDHIQARLSALMSDLTASQLEQSRANLLLRKLEGKVHKLEKDLQAARTSEDSIGRHLVLAKGEVQIERAMRVKMEEERERERKKLEEVKGMLFSA